VTAAERAREMRERQRKPQVTSSTGVEPTSVTATPAPPAPAKDVRQTVDLPHARHLAFAAWRMETAVQLGRSRLTTQDALSAMVQVVLTDEVVARRVRAFLEAADET
jgi:hypothetical protein